MIIIRLVAIEDTIGRPFVEQGQLWLSFRNGVRCSVLRKLLGIVKFFRRRYNVDIVWGSSTSTVKP